MTNHKDGLTGCDGLTGYDGLTGCDDEKLIDRFFGEAGRQEIADEGFSERVMARIAQQDVTAGARSALLCRLWTWFCLLVGAVLFMVLNGWAQLVLSARVLLSAVLTQIEVVITTAPTTEILLTPATVVLIAVFLLVVLPYQTARKLCAVL